MSNGRGYVSGKRKEISTALGQQQEPGEVLGCGKKKEQKKQSTEWGVQPNSEGWAWAASLAETGRDFQRARQSSEEFAAAWKITELAESRPGNKGLSARMHSASQELLFLSCLTMFEGSSIYKVNYSSLYLNKIGFLGFKSLQYLLDNSL